VDALTYDLLKIARRKAEGSFATQANRRTMLKQMAETLKSGGFLLPSARSIKPKHIQYLIERWREAEISDRTILNRLAVLRWWTEAVDKKSIMARDNETYGVSKPAPSGKARAYNLAPEQLQFIPCPRVQASLELQAAFGLRREEAIKFRPGEALLADVPDRIVLKASWTKGGRRRSVPIVSEQQRDLLARVAALVGTGSLIPKDKTYVAQLEAYKYQTRKAGIRNPHGLRHAYAQARYRELTGWEPPATGGKRPDTAEAAAIDAEIRRQISEELGHNRIAITKVYLG
jgi:integrase